MSNCLGQFQDVISRRLGGVGFSYYTSDEIRKLSVKEITNPIAFDSLNRPIKGGLYDPCMGVSPYDKFTRCETCGCEGLECPGHMSHVELLLPVYNPFMIDRLLKLLRAQCLSCNQFRMTKQKLKMFAVMFTLMKLGYIFEAKEYKQVCESLNMISVQNEKEATQAATPTAADRRRKSSDLKSSDTEVIMSKKGAAAASSSSTGESEGARKFKNTIKSLEERRKALQNIMNIREGEDAEKFTKGVTYTNAMNKTFEETLKEFWGSINVGKCPHCKKQQSAIRKEGFSKFFIKKSATSDGKKGSVSSGKDDYDSSEDDHTDSGAAASSSFSKQPLDKNIANQKYLDPLEIKEYMRKFWAQEKKLLNIIYGTIETNSSILAKSKKGFMIRRNDYNMFFIEVIPVTPNRFRPENKLGEQTFLHGHTVVLTKILSFNVELRRMIVLQKQNLSDDKKQKLFEQFEQRFTNQLTLKQNSNFQQNVSQLVKLNDVITKWLDIQEAVNCFLDSTKATKALDREGTGIRQLLEKKEGLFRMKMMGKRVNYAARSVISPDPNLNTNEVGVPLFVAKKLTFPEFVNEYNAKHLRQLIVNGPFQHPGANFVVENGNKISLEALNEQQRIALAKTLLNNAKNKVVYRHLQSGDVLLFNRQPTLHKASLMSHIARVLPREQTIRMHYANCKSYNADFDGDEMNLHFMQSHLARAEGYYISLNDRQFINTTNGNPLRELIQDSIISAVFLTHKEKFLEKEVFQELIYAATWNMFEKNNKNGSTNKPYKLFMVPPAIQKPRQLWTGKQLITNIIKIVVQQNQKKDYEQGIYMDMKAKLTSDELTGIYKDDTMVIFRDNELLQGIIDKNQFGAGATYGLMHAFFELYGASLTGNLFTALAKLLSAHLQMHGFTCGMDDLLVHKDTDAKRLQEIKQAHVDGVKACAEFAGMKDYEVPKSWNLYNRPTFELNSKGKYSSNVLKRKPGVDYLAEDDQILDTLEKKLVDDPQLAESLDNVYKSTLAQQGSKILATSLGGLIKKFPFNNFTTMTNSGAKGSKVNHTQVSALLGQQELEGRRVPVMATGRTLPCFLPYDPNPRAGGFISDRFLSGLRPAEFFFHCMAGREGLIDTAVKTSRSGYLQRCLMKHLEGLKVAYDYTVRDADGSVVQFYYGEDSIDPNKVKYLEKFRFLSENFRSFTQKYDPYHLKESHDTESVNKFLKNRKRAANDENAAPTHDTIMNNFLPGKYIGSVSERVYKNLKEYIKKEESSEDKYSNIFHAKKDQLTPSKFRVLFNVKYLNSLIHPGDSVGCLAAQAIGEPSTQMTLNTFHLAGHGGVNLTLGIPRLREILMTATDKLKTPMMLLNLSQPDVASNKELAQNHARKLQKINLLELVNNIEVKEQKIIVRDHTILPFNERFRHYQININLENLEAIDYAFQLSIDQIVRRVEKIFLPNLLSYISKELKRDLKSELQTRVFKKKEENANNSGIETEGLASDYDQRSDAVSDAEELKNLASEVEYSIFTETEDETKAKPSKSVPSVITSETAKKSTQRTKSDLYASSRYYNGHSLEGSTIICHIKLPLDSKKLLMANLVEKILKKTLVYEVKNISNATILKKEAKGATTYQIQTEGVNFKAIWKLDHFDSNTIDSNDIAALNKCYGIEAARNAIVKEIVTVFGVYGVVVDYRHLYLIADYLTFSGEMKAMNRVWMDESISPFLKMSFETCVKFLTNAATNNEIDTLATPSSQIVLGRVPQVGTGVFDILHQI